MQTQLRQYNYTEINTMWNAIGDFLRIAKDNNVYIYGRYSYLCELPQTTELYILKRNDCILFENSNFYFDQIVGVHCYQMLDMHGRVIQNPLRIITESDNMNPFVPRKALYMSVTVRNYRGPEVPEDFENEQYTHEYYFMKTTYGIFVSSNGFGSPQNMQLISLTKTRDMNDEEMTDLIRSTYDEDFSEDDNDISISMNRSNDDNSHIPMM